uniref:Uncharacterized protein n=1 Tax=uncultured marine virus TaxID=186617 RepID=A0A0F7L8Z2_9VIRU|nr:hypothetical protein [uncultured marine virus]
MSGRDATAGRGPLWRWTASTLKVRSSGDRATSLRAPTSRPETAPRRVAADTGAGTAEAEARSTSRERAGTAGRPPMMMKISRSRC